jgi:hypothetical protein
MVDVLIPVERLEQVTGGECIEWLLANIKGAAFGRKIEGRLNVSFENLHEAEAFRKQWLAA